MMHQSVFDPPNGQADFLRRSTRTSSNYRSYLRIPRHSSCTSTLSGHPFQIGKSDQHDYQSSETDLSPCGDSADYQERVHIDTPLLHAPVADECDGRWNEHKKQGNGHRLQKHEKDHDGSGNESEKTDDRYADWAFHEPLRCRPPLTGGVKRGRWNEHKKQGNGHRLQKHEKDHDGSGNESEKTDDHSLASCVH